jgi:hypothetical protein
MNTIKKVKQYSGFIHTLAWVSAGEQQGVVNNKINSYGKR